MGGFRQALLLTQSYTRSKTLLQCATLANERHSFQKGHVDGRGLGKRHLQRFCLQAEDLSQDPPI